MRISVLLNAIDTLTDTELLRAVIACDKEIARCKIVKKVSESALQVRKAGQKIQLLQNAKDLFMSEYTNRQQRAC